ncbi:hypothetical protein RHMOL_Rhmol05G0148600 [Rhododendron molle]|nr:hypothetical protein RHMOL_Rhmol05G0148600 [Rhododendron molle]
MPLGIASLDVLGLLTTMPLGIASLDVLGLSTTMPLGIASLDVLGFSTTILLGVTSLDVLGLLTYSHQTAALQQCLSIAILRQLYAHIQPTRWLYAPYLQTGSTL